MFLKRTARAFLALAAAGCHSGAPPTPPATSVFCGALCSQGVVVLSATATAQGLRFSLQSPTGDYPALAFFAALPGTSLQALTYDVTNGTGATTLVQESPSGGTQWTQAASATVNVGSFSLTIADAGEALATDAGTSWPAPQGCLTATLLPVGTLTDAGLGVSVAFPATTNVYVLCPDCLPAAQATCPPAVQ